MGKWNEIEIAKSVERVKAMERGSWELVAAVNVPSDWSRAHAGSTQAACR
ncbi:hypothetical protein PC116_g14099 [Phytophthora cactorum]|nr:hypothetical protein PC116_g14099 [Phytophthora cactorum]